LILDEPFDGLDNLSRLWLADSIKDLMKRDVQVILVTHRVAEIVDGISHIMLLKDGRVIAQGKCKDMLHSYFKEGDALNNSQISNRVAELEKSTPPAPSILPDQQQIVVMRNVTVKYGPRTTLSGFNWTMKQGQNWAIVGPNGAGKTTLLNLIFGDNPQAYANEIYLFGRRRGSGDSIWDIKQRIGFISSEFQIRYRKRMRVLDVVVSGFYDSVGLYRQADPEKMKIAKQWIKLFGIDNLSAENFKQLSYGEQRMVLLARAVVKSPFLLILDEPCQGLDPANRKKMLDLFDLIGRTGRTQLIYVTHYPEEIPECITHVLQFEKKPQGGFSTFTKPF
ncbi:MAG: ATP-binding cassette domain-containing protein, partial [Desulfobacterales bacterium]